MREYLSWIDANDEEQGEIGFYLPTEIEKIIQIGGQQSQEQLKEIREQYKEIAYMGIRQAGQGSGNRTFKHLYKRMTPEEKITKLMAESFNAGWENGIEQAIEEASLELPKFIQDKMQSQLKEIKDRIEEQSYKKVAYEEDWQKGVNDGIKKAIMILNQYIKDNG